MCASGAGTTARAETRRLGFPLFVDRSELSVQVEASLRARGSSDRSRRCNRKFVMGYPDRSCVIIVENLPVPFDRRVWQEATALIRAGWRVSVICPSNGSSPEPFESHRLWPLPPVSAAARGARSGCGYFREYSAALFHQARLLIKVYRERGFSIIQACNPPDLTATRCRPAPASGSFTTSMTSVRSCSSSSSRTRAFLQGAAGLRALRT